MLTAPIITKLSNDTFAYVSKSQKSDAVLFQFSRHPQFLTTGHSEYVKNSIDISRWLCMNRGAKLTLFHHILADYLFQKQKQLQSICVINM